MEIERKWLVKTLPDISKLISTKFERYFLYIKDGLELRVQKRDEKYELERKVAINSLSSDKTTIEISKDEFEHFKSLSIKSIIRENYSIQHNPEINIKIYHGDFEGLLRVEVDFNTEEEAKSYFPLDWFGKEITDTELGKDSKLIKLSQEDFKNILINFS